MTATLTFDISFLYMVAADVIGILVIVLYAKHRGRKLQHALAQISSTSLQYFRITGVAVQVLCQVTSNGSGFNLMIDTELIKQFRMLHLIEIALREHIQQTCNVQIDKVFWRFAVREKVGADGENPSTSYELEESNVEAFEALLKMAENRLQVAR
jgi:hypothetical protein